jgi:hypothetical protein
MPVNGKPNGRFELPALAPINFNLTDGTNIPPPPDSPIEEAPPAPKPALAQAAPPIATNGEIKQATNANGEYDGRGRTSTYDKPPLSPASTTRPSSIRRFLSRKSLNANYTNGTNTNASNEDLTGIGRPDSPSSFFDGRPSGPKKSGSWFRRLGSSNRTSVIYENKPDVKKVPSGPPAPKLPELNQLKSKVSENDQGGFGGEDLFKNIK